AEMRRRWGATALQPSLRGGPGSGGAVRVPRQFLDLARQAAAASDPARWQILYDTLWRLVHENRDLLKDARDPGVHRFQTLVTSKRAESKSPDSEKSVESQGEGAAPFVPAKAGLSELRAAATHCKGCDLY